LVHSSTLVTAGLIVIMVYTESIINSYIILLILIVGVITIIIGRVQALFERSIKKMVAYSTLSQMGLRIITVGLGCYQMGLFNLVSHGLAKRILFIQVGFLIHQRIGQQNIRGWNRPNSSNTLMQIQLACSLFSLCGIMFTGGIRRKEVLLTLILERRLCIILLFLILICVFITFIYRIFIWVSLFNFNNNPMVTTSNSIIIIIVTYLEVFLVIIYFS
jgi:NADH:ubiquinone oxidoreductase subunit 5 (subunit L)/multisubunit Na+/H+ antiporter MnhA subunit